MSDARTGWSISVKDAPAILGLTFRHFRGDEDFAAILDTHTASSLADGLEHQVMTPDTIRHNYRATDHHDPHKDVFIAEIDGTMVAYGRVVSRLELDGTHIYFLYGFVRPEWRGKGLGRALLRLIEGRAREMQSGVEEGGVAYANMDSENHRTDLIELLESEGYAPIRYEFDMETPDLDHIPEAPMPEGLEVRPALPEDYLDIVRASVEAFKDEWGAVEMSDADIERWLKNPIMQKELWVVAWDGDQVAGSIFNYIDPAYNERTGRKLGYTEYISVRRPWRRRGLARAMIARSMRVLRDAGMTQTALGVDADSLSGALRLYESMGYKVVSAGTTYRKQL